MFMTVTSHYLNRYFFTLKKWDYISIKNMYDEVHVILFFTINMYEISKIN